MKTKFKKVVVLALLGMFLVQSSANIKTMAALNPSAAFLESDREDHPIMH